MDTDTSKTLVLPVAHSVVSLSKALERRRSGRMVEISRNLLSLLQRAEAADCPNAITPITSGHDQNEYDSRAFQGIVFGVGLSAVLWLMSGVAFCMFYR